MEDEYTRYPRVCSICERTYHWTNKEIWLSEQNPNMPCGHPWHFLQDVELDFRVFEIKSRQADDPEADRTYYYRLREVKEHFPMFYELVKPQGFVHTTFVADLQRIEISVCS